MDGFEITSSPPPKYIRDIFAQSLFIFLTLNSEIDFLNAHIFSMGKSKAPIRDKKVCLCQAKECYKYRHVDKGLEKSGLQVSYRTYISHKLLDRCAKAQAYLENSTDNAASNHSGRYRRRRSHTPNHHTSPLSPSLPVPGPSNLGHQPPPCTVVMAEPDLEPYDTSACDF